MSVALSSDDRSVIDRKILSESSTLDAAAATASFEHIFEVERCVGWIEEKKVENVTLQFPDQLLPFSAQVALAIESRVQKRVSILGDTSYGECCVDEVAAEHIGADAVIHFGNACLTRTRRLPVLHIYTELPIDVQLLAENIKSKFVDEQNVDLAIFYDVRFHRKFESNKNIFEEIKSSNGKFSNILICEPSPESEVNVQCGRICAENLDENWRILFVGKSENFANLLGLTFPQAAGHFMYDPSAEIPTIESSAVSVKKALMKRYYLIERARDAARIGIVVGTLGVTRYRNVIDYVKAIIKDSGKKSYTFLVGKPNVPKLANFAEIDLFVLVACPENSIVDSKDFLAPIITPFELDVALNKDRPWTGNFVANFSEILPKGKHFVPFRQEDQEMDISLISGKVRATNLNSDEGGTSALATQQTSLSVLHQSGGGEFLLERSWRGLEQKLGETEVRDAVEGRPGIASGYQGEGEE